MNAHRMAHLLVLTAVAGMYGCNRSPAPPPAPTPVAQAAVANAVSVPDHQSAPVHVDIGSTTRANAGANPQPYGAAAPMAQGSDGQPPAAPMSPPAALAARQQSDAAPRAATMIEAAPPGAGLPPGSNTAQPATLNATELRFFAQAGELNIFEARAAQVAASRANDSAIKSYAALVAADQATISTGLQQLSTRLGVPLVTSLSVAKQEAVEGLNRATPESFDRQFMQVAGARAQQNTIAMFEQTAREANNPAVRDFVNATLPMLRSHVDAANKLPIHE